MEATLRDLLTAALGALIFGGCAAYGISKGRFRIMKQSGNPYLERRNAPIQFWTYAILLIVAAVVLTYISIFVA